MNDILARWLTQWRYPLLILSLIACASIGYGAKSLYFESDYRLFFRDNDPYLVAHERMQTEFTKSDNVVFVVIPRDGNVFTRENLAAVETLTAEGWKLPYAIRVDSITNYQHSRADGDDLAVAALVENATALTDAELAEKRRIALSEPLLAGFLVAKQAQATLVNVRLEMPRVQGGADLATPEAMQAARDLPAKISSQYPDVDIQINGLVAVNQGFNELAQQDASTLVPAMFGIVVLALLIFLRSISATISVMLVILLSITLTLGFAGHIGYALNQISVSAPTIILTLSISDCVHLLMHYLQGLGKGRSKVEAIEESLRINLVPVFLTSFTTAIGFLALNFSDSPPFRELGTISAFGVMGAMVLAYTFLPGLVTLLPIRIRQGMGQEAHWRLVDQVGEFAIRRRVPIFWVTLALTAVFASFIPLNELRDDTVEYFAEENPVRISAEYLEKNLSGFDSINYQLDSGEPGGVADPAFLQKVEAFAQWWRQQPETGHVSVFTDIMKRLNRNMHGDDPTYDRLPDDRELAAQYVLLYELSLPMGLDLNSDLNQDKSSLRMGVNLHNLSSVELIALEHRAQAWLEQHAPGMAKNGSSISLMFAHIGQNNIVSMVQGAFWTILLISATMILSLRSWKFGLISLVPNALPALIAFGFWGLFSGKVNLAAAGVYSISLGIIVDDTIHFFSKYLHARRVEGYSPEQAVRYVYGTVGSALLVTTVVLTLGFGALTFSDFTVNSTMGLMTALIIAVALIFDLLFLPALLLFFDRDKKAAAKIPA